MCTVSTATPAATEGLSRAVRKQRSGRRRFPPAARASPATSWASPGCAATARASPASTSAMYAATPGVACTCASWLTSPFLHRVRHGTCPRHVQAKSHFCDSSATLSCACLTPAMASRDLAGVEGDDRAGEQAETDLAEAGFAEHLG